MIPINRLPLEILGQIFCLAIFSGNQKDRRLKFLYSVCQRWRYTVLVTGTLWTDVSINMNSDLELERVSTYFSRSKAAPLSLTLHHASYYSHTMRIWMSKISKELHRIRNLTLPSSNDFELLFKIMKYPIPSLEQLNMHGSDLSSHDSHHISPSFLGSGVPNIRSLKLQGFNSWPRGFFANLTELSLCLKYRRIFMTDFLDLLQDSPRLEILYLQDTSPMELVNTPCSHSITLLHLSSLTLRNCNTISILLHLVVPESTHVDIEGPTLHPTNDLTFVLSSQSILTPLPLDYTRLHVLREVKSLAITTDCVDFGIIASNSRGSLKIWQQKRDVPTLDEVVHNSIRAISLFPPFFSIESLELHEDSPDWTWGENEAIHIDLWRGWFTQLLKLKTLKLQMGCAWRIYEALVPNDGSEGIPFPKLEELEVAFIVADTESRDDKKDILTHITNFLEYRARVGRPLRSLVVHLDVDPAECDPSDWTPRWRELVKEFKLTVVDPDMRVTMLREADDP